MLHTPHIEDTQVTFTWNGEHPAQVVGDFNDWGIRQPATPMQKIEDHLWSCTVTLPRDSYIEYALVVNGERFPDPQNPNQVNDGIGHINSFFWMPDITDTPLIQRRRGIPRGKVTRHSVEGGHFIINGSREVHLYQPPVSEPVPLLVVLDGTDYLKRSFLPTIVDNLIAQKRIRPIALAMIQSYAKGRGIEYGCSDSTVAYIVHHVLPYARERLNLLDVQQYPGAYGMMGASMGGLMSLYTALRAPELFGHVLCQSGAFGADAAAYRLYYRSCIEDLIQYAPVPAIQVWMDVGIYEWFITPNRHMHGWMQQRGYDVKYVEHNSGHNHPSWRNILWRGLEHLYRSE